ncbi:MAG: hypothetical protein A2X85_14300 [Geobacteraceae bacterium GWF2_54_21]|nr:MAG: hypothetical protein A2X85_14300 [Geobacteraceae bacterium GWF2_54_21]
MSCCTPLVSIIIPTYNSASFITEAIDSCLMQTYTKFEIIVINDGSTDNTDEVVLKYIDKITYIKQENAGAARARNLGIAEAKGDYIAFLDADDIWITDKLQKQIEIMKRNPNIALVYGKFENFSEGTNEILSIMPDSIQSGFLFDHILINNLIGLSSVLVRKSVLDEVGSFDERLLTAEDTNLWLKIAYKYPFGVVSEILFRRRIHGGNISERVDIKVGTLDNLDWIVELYPEVSPKKYTPMKEAYLIKGEAMAVDMFHGGAYSKCNAVCKKLITMNVSNAKILIYFVITLLPASLISKFRNAMRFFR